MNTATAPELIRCRVLLKAHSMLEVTVASDLTDHPSPVWESLSTIKLGHMLIRVSLVNSAYLSTYPNLKQ